MLQARMDVEGWKKVKGNKHDSKRLRLFPLRNKYGNTLFAFPFSEITNPLCFSIPFFLFTLSFLSVSLFHIFSILSFSDAKIYIFTNIFSGTNFIQVCVYHTSKHRYNDDV